MSSKTDSEAQEIDATAEQLPLRKVDLEIRNLRADLLLKPFVLLTPLVLAVDVYILIQAPEREAECRGFVAQIG
ncbi:MAG: hypothetical protein ACFB11_22805 [Paracoccaceae bacterium]